MRTTPPAPRGGAQWPSRKIDCVAGDPACDAEPDDETGWTIQLSLCLGQTGPRAPACVVSPLAGVEVLRPRTRGGQPFERELGALLRHRIGAGGLGLSGGSPFVNATPDYCTAATAVRVPLRETASGRLRPGRTKVKLAARAEDGRRDVDTLVVRCRPPARSRG